MSNAIVIIAKTHNHAEAFARAIYGTVSTVPIRHSVTSAEDGLRGTRNRVIYLVDLNIREVTYLKAMHDSRNTMFEVYWTEPSP